MAMDGAGSTPRPRRPRRQVWYRSGLVRVSIAGLRGRFTPQRYRRLSTVQLEHAGHLVELRIIQQPCPGAYGGIRRWLLCPRCGGRAQTVGCHPELGWACPALRCVGGWKGRTRRKLAGPEDGELVGDSAIR
ncbi:hypothetical protein MVI01_70610 [Myxococcus virescens]|uniref:Uncharacterized protein n=1 Tax=Myxococcus virescens TaxID=83456 RepID=A0A511HNX1_9BACT|nr:hypothetical protein MVI01_70610 [Myxococcus virescens]